MNKLFEEMDCKEIHSEITSAVSFEISKMINEQKISLESAVSLLKQIGYRNLLKNIYIEKFASSLVNPVLTTMILNEIKRKEANNEKLLVDLCECYLGLQHYYFIEENVLSTCISCLLKEALNKDESMKTQKEVEMALLSLSGIDASTKIKRKHYFEEITEIIEYHQEHHNLTHLAYQSAWMFLIDRLICEKEFGGTVVNKLHFAREAVKELDYLKGCVDWKKREKSFIKAKEMWIIQRWNAVLRKCFNYLQFYDGVDATFVACIINVCEAAKKKYIDMFYEYLSLLKRMDNIKSMDCLLRGGAVDYFLVNIFQSTFDRELTKFSLNFFSILSKRLNKKKKNENDQSRFGEFVKIVSFAWNLLSGNSEKGSENAKRELAIKMTIFEKLEEEGFEDAILSFNGSFLELKFNKNMLTNPSEYIVYDSFFVAFL
ncbi:uncharacterized protein MONOS_17606 [Monocercomonoides exilis]|uniref:uncharacterized protein n=1 Tax=Monocercomonoides exilis TaxID=2049356 RepID=UPI003559DFA3|nr:hypothetical protein MONOS_17606 [Monocercomonoides exilis]